MKVITTKDGLRHIVMSEKMFDRLRDQISDLGWELDRMSSSGVEIFKKICRTLNIEV